MAAQKTMGTTLTITSQTPDLEIVDVRVIGEFGVESEEIDVTTLDSADGYRETIGSLKDSGEVTFEGFVKTAGNSASLFALAEAQSIEEFEIEFPDGAKAEFEGWIKSYKDTGAEVEGVRGFTGTIRINGAVDFTDAPAPSV
jgi:predicted secreted protein